MPNPQVFSDLGEWTHAPAVIDRALTLFEALSSGLKIVYVSTSTFFLLFLFLVVSARHKILFDIFIHLVLLWRGNLLICSLIPHPKNNRYAAYSLPRVYSNGKLLLESEFMQTALHSSNGEKFAFLNGVCFVSHS